MKKRPWLVVAILCLALENLVAGSSVQVQFKGFPADYEVHLGDRVIPQVQGRPKEYKILNLPFGTESVTITSAGYEALVLPLNLKKATTFEFKLEKESDTSKLRKIAELETGQQPKSVTFSPDGKYVFVALLLGRGIDVFTVDPPAFVKTIVFPEKYAKQLGFVECAVIPWQDELWVSQMTTDSVHVIELSTLTYKETMATGGSWPKVIAAHPTRDLVYVSNWVGQSVAVFDSRSKKRVGLYKTTGTPRGLAFSPDGVYLYVASFGTGALDKIRVSNGDRVKTINMGAGAKRHLVASKTNNYLFATDMERGELWVFDMVTDTVVKKLTIGPKLNTCDLSPDGKFLFISSRGTNGPRDYLFPGPDFGTMSVVDTTRIEKIDWVWGRNQPTGLAVSPVGKTVVFSDFLDHVIEFYDYSPLCVPNSMAKVTE